jgi:hypothetical protein
MEGERTACFLEAYRALKRTVLLRTQEPSPAVGGLSHPLNWAPAYEGARVRLTGAIPHFPLSAGAEGDQNATPHPHFTIFISNNLAQFLPVTNSRSALAS